MSRDRLLTHEEAIDVAKKLWGENAYAWIEHDELHSGFKCLGLVETKPRKLFGIPLGTRKVYTYFVDSFYNCQNWEEAFRIANRKYLEAEDARKKLEEKRKEDAVYAQYLRDHEGGMPLGEKKQAKNSKPEPTSIPGPGRKYTP